MPAPDKSAEVRHMLEQIKKDQTRDEWVAKRSQTDEELHIQAGAVGDGTQSWWHCVCGWTSPKVGISQSLDAEIVKQHLGECSSREPVQAHGFLANATEATYCEVPETTITHAIVGLLEVAPKMIVGDYWRVLAHLGKYGLIHPDLYARVPEFAKKEAEAVFQ